MARERGSKVATAPFLSQEIFEGSLDSCFKHKDGLVQLQLSANDFIRNVEGDLRRFKYLHNVGNTSDSTCNLSLNSGEEKMGLGSTARRALFQKMPQFFSESMIVAQQFATKDLYSYGKCVDPVVRVIGTSTATNATEACIFPYATRINSAETTPFYRYNKCPQLNMPASGGVLCNQIPYKKHDFDSYKHGALDLNTVYVEKCEKRTIAWSKDVADLQFKENFVDLTLTDSDTEISVKDSSGSGASGVSANVALLKTFSRSSVRSFEEAANCVGLQEDDKFDLNLDPVIVCSCDLEESKEKSIMKDPVLSSDQCETLQKGVNNEVPASCNSCSTDNDLISVKTSQSAITSSGSLQSLQAYPSEVANVSNEEDKSKDSNHSGLKEEAAPMDLSIQNAAESLVLMSSENSSCIPESHADVDNSKIEHKDELQRSSDSYELLTLKQPESNVDDNSVTSKPLEDNCSEESKRYALTLRRGRRLKDFRREILPSLTSLSRAEICEDITLMEGVLRSKEYRKFRDKTAAHEDNSPALTKRRRTRLNRSCLRR